VNEEKNMSKEIENYLDEHGIRPSYQRTMIYEYLVKHKNHPTVDMIYNELADSMPTLSKTTVYNTLNLFVEKKVSLLLHMKDGEARYDADVSLHGHFKCERCENIYDFEVEPSGLVFKGLENYKLNEIQVSCKGICPSCRNQ
jgi:Fe2+ or Zn2+ uptake regulation protein